MTPGQMTIWAGVVAYCLLRASRAHQDKHGSVENLTPGRAWTRGLLIIAGLGFYAWSLYWFIRLLWPG